MYNFTILISSFNFNVQYLIDMIRKHQLLVLSTLLIFTYTTMNAQEIIKIWEMNPPTSNEITEVEKYERNGNWVINVSSP